MIKHIKGNILESKAQALVNTVNTVGIMGKGIALQFKKAFPNNYRAYVDACKNKNIDIGKLFVFTDSNMLSGEKIIINFPTKIDWKKPSEYEYINKGLDNLITIIKSYNIKSIAIPPLGAGNGGLEWEKVKKILNEKLKDIDIDIDILIYEPTKQIKEKLKAERVKLTKARALLLYLLFDLVKNGEYVSEFSSEKVCYFLQIFGAKKYFKLQYTPNFYGPYSGKVRYLLNILNGSYIMGYSDMNKKPFEPITLLSDTYETVIEYVNKDKELSTIAKKTTDFLDGFYSDFSLELLSSVHFLIKENKTTDKKIIKMSLTEWNDRKSSLFTNEKYIEIAINHIKSNAPQQKI